MKSIVLRIGLTLAAVAGFISSYSQVHDPLSAFARNMENALAVQYRLETRHVTMMSDSVQLSQAFVHIRFDSSESGRKFFVYSPGRDPVLYNGRLYIVKLDEMTLETYNRDVDILLRGMSQDNCVLEFRGPQFNALVEDHLRIDSSYIQDGLQVIIYRADLPPEGDITASWLEIHLDGERALPLKYVTHFEMLETFEQHTEHRFIDFVVDQAKEEMADTSSLVSIFEICYKDRYGKTHELADARGKILLLDFWYKGCYPCRKSMPVIQNLYERADTNEILILGVNPFDNWDDRIARALLEKLNIQYPQAFVKPGVAELLKVTAYPSLLLFDRQGNLCHTDRGYRPGLGREIQAEIDRLR